MTLSSPARERILVIKHGALGDIVPAEGGGSPSLHRTGIDQRRNAQRLAPAARPVVRPPTADGRLQHVATP